MDKQYDGKEQHHEDLFDRLDKNRKRRKRNILIAVTIVVLVLSVVGIMMVSSLKESVWLRFGSGAGEVLSCKAVIGTISATVSGSGVLSDGDLEYVSVPEGVEVVDVLVKTNDAVSEGQAVATVDMQSVRRTMTQLQQKLQSLDQQIHAAEDDEVGETVRSGVTGRVKVIYASEGDAVEQVMNEKGALAVLSLDGYMAVDVPAADLVKGDTVSVKLTEKLVPGRVNRIAGGGATVLISDNGPQLDEEATVLNLDGDVLGIGKLYIHSPFRITGFTGTVAKIQVKTNDAVTASTQLFTLGDTSVTVNLDTLLRQRTELEDMLMELLRIQKYGAVVSPVSGSVFSVEETDVPTVVAVISADEKMVVTIPVDESDILTLQLGQLATVTVGSVGEEPVHGVVTGIEKTITEGAYSAEITVDKSYGMLSGMTADIGIQIRGAENVVIIPAKALNLTQSGAYVYTGYNPDTGKYEGLVEVVAGIRDGDFVEIKAGLREGDTVYYTDATTAKDLVDRMSGAA